MMRSAGQAVGTVGPGRDQQHGRCDLATWQPAELVRAGAMRAERTRSRRNGEPD